MPDFANQLLDFYKFISPADNVGQFAFDTRVGANTTTAPGQSPTRTTLIEASRMIKNTVVENFVPGFETTPSLINDIRNVTNMGPNSSDALNSMQEQYLLAIQGQYNVLTQKCGTAVTEILYPVYFARPAPTTPSKSNGSGARRPESAQPLPTPNPISNFWAEVCNEKDAGPPIDLTISLVRAPMVSRSSNKTDLIAFYLTSMPPTFANQLVPYCDVEFQLPVLAKSTTQNSTTPQDVATISRPSLYRFLMGSGQQINSLTEADKSIANLQGANVKKANKNVPYELWNQHFFGNEMFTSPQTLFNYNALNKTGGETGSPSRLNDAKPFLPPATLSDLSITVQNAGQRTFAKYTAGMKLRIHDRRRLAEMSEFLRGADGYNRTIVWITFGMTAPRSRGDSDLYAKLINENMLVRMAFTIFNTQFNFTPEGGVEVNLSLASKGSHRIETSPLTFDGIEEVKSALNSSLQQIKQEASDITNDVTEKTGFSQSEIKMAQFIAGAASGNIPNKDDKEYQNSLKAAEGSLRRKKSNGSKTAERALDLLDLLKRLIENNTSLPTKGQNFANNKLQNLDGDPFFPDASKNDLVFHQNAAKTRKEWITLAAQKNKPENSIKYFDDDLIKAVGGAERSKYVSLGRLFSTLCLPSITRAIANEFNWSVVDKRNNDAKCPYELQVIFYQLNTSCGPVSCHNIAEFPMDKHMFVDGFGKLVAAQGGDELSLHEMMSFINDQLEDPRQPGYGRRLFYKPFEPAAKEQKLQSAFPTEDSLNTQLDAWTKVYGDFVTPNLLFELEVGYSPLNSTRSNVSTNPMSKDLLSKLSGRVAAGYNEPNIIPGAANEKTIIKLHIYDRTFNPNEKMTKALRIADDGTFYVVSSEFKDNKELLQGLKDKKSEALPRGMTINGNQVEINGQTAAVNIGQGKEALMNFLGQMVPRIVVGTEGSMISAANLQSKTDGLVGTIAMRGGVAKRETSIASTGLSQQQYNQPMLMYPAQLSLTTIGCPLAALQQKFIVDFDTNTTLDDEYTVISVTHNFAPGKYETSWTFCFGGAYGRMISDNDITSVLKNIDTFVAKSEKDIANARAQLSKKPGPPPGASKNKKNKNKKNSAKK
jgi:hypothetical protein